jgi:hypothetical protein
MTGREILVYLAIKHQGEWDQIVAAIRNREFFDSKEAEAVVASVKSKVVTIVDPDYPQALKEGPEASVCALLLRQSQPSRRQTAMLLPTLALEKPAAMALRWQKSFADSSPATASPLSLDLREASIPRPPKQPLT